MDFGLDETQLAIGELAERMLRDFSTPERLLKLEEGRFRVDRELWSALQEAGITRIGIAEEHGGTGLGFAETSLVLEHVGQTVAAVPLLTHNVALQTLQQADALADLRRFLDEPGWITATARTDAGNTLRELGGGLTGAVSAIPYAPEASALLVPARTDGQWALYLVAAGQPGVQVVPQLGTDQSPMGELKLQDVNAIRVGGAALLEWMEQRLLAGSCALQVGVVEEAIRMTAAYVGEREAFGVRIGTFQAVSQRMADAYIDAMALKLMSRDAASKLVHEGSAMADVLAAKMLAGDVGHRVLASCQHVHGGIGHDRTYPLWRYAVAVKQNELAGLSSTAAAARLGQLMAADRECAVR